MTSGERSSSSPPLHVTGPFQRAYALDLRSLAVFRSAVAAVVLGDLMARAQNGDLRAFYTDAGVLPRSVLIEHFLAPPFWSLHLATGTTIGQAVFFLIAAAAALALLIGWKTRMATVASWVLLVSLQTRDPLVLQGGDVLLRLLLFWGMFLPLGSRWSLDALRDHEEFPDGKPVEVFSGGAIGFTAQIAMVYLFAFLWKSGPEWQDGTAVQYALNLETMTRPLGRWLAQYPDLTRILTFATITVEAAVPGLLLVPFRARAARKLAVALVLLLQLGFAVFLRVGHYPFIAAAAMLAFLPGDVWQDPAESHVSPRPLKVSRVTSLVAAIFAVYCFLWNLSGVRQQPPALEPIGLALRIDQEWSMFAPRPLAEDGWYVMPGVTRSGQAVDVWHQRPGAPAWEKPPAEAVYHEFTSERWAVFLMDLHEDAGAGYRPGFAQYLCREANEGRAAGDPNALQSFEIYFMVRPDQLRHEPKQDFRKKFLYRQDCL